MEINVGQFQSVYSTSQYGNASATSSNQMQLPGMFSEEESGISGGGQMMALLSGLDSSERSEMASFRDAVMSAQESGSFDAGELAESAPDALKDFASEKGLELESLLEGIAAKLEEGPPPGGPRGPGGMGGRPPGPPSAEMASFMDSIVAAVDSDESDVDALAEEAPEEIVSMAEARDMEVSELIEEMMSRVEEEGDPRDLQPPPQIAQQGIDAYTQSGQPESRDPMAGFLGMLLDS